MKTKEVNFVLLIAVIFHQYVHNTGVGIPGVNNQGATSYFDNFTRAVPKRDTSTDPKVSLSIDVCIIIQAMFFFRLSRHFRLFTWIFDPLRSVQI